MNIETGLITGFVAGAGAAWRAFKGYQAHMKKKKYEEWSWVKFLETTLPAVAMAFVAGATYEPLPELLSVDGITLMMMLFVGGAGVGSLQGKLPWTKPKK